MFAGLIIGMPAWLRIGSETSVQPELNSPRYATAFGSVAALRPLAAHWPRS